MDTFQQNDQVIVKRKMRNGNLVRFGSIVRLDGDKAAVFFPIDHTQAVIPVSQLEKTERRFGVYARVQPSPVMRSMAPSRNRHF